MNNSGLLPSFDFIEKSVSLKFPSRKFSTELKKLSFILEVSALEAVKTKREKIKTKYFFIIFMHHIMKLLRLKY